MLLELAGAVAVAAITALLTMRVERAKLERDHAAQLDRLREELKLEYSVETAIRHLLDKQGWELRSFDAISHHIRGFKPDDLRQHLVRAGAVAFEDGDKVEKWGLLEKNADKLAKKAPANG